MRLACFFVLSLVLHAAALAYPVSFRLVEQPDHIAVTILPLEPETYTTDANVGTRKTAQTAGAVAGRKPLRTNENEVAAARISNPQSSPISAEVIDWISDSRVMVATSASQAEYSNAAPSVASGENGAGGNGSGGQSNGIAGSGLGSGAGRGSSGSGIVLTQARYSDTPKPVYPENARREGREGRVILRVLIDDQGRTKSVELNTSSGSKALDQAATEAIKRWRFHPAYAGDTPVDSWVNVPIDFRLTDARN
jgi:periplasmic protein TonB